jgi:hypothetical protein
MARAARAQPNRPRRLPSASRARAGALASQLDAQGCQAGAQRRQAERVVQLARAAAQLQAHVPQALEAVQAAAPARRVAVVHLELLDRLAYGVAQRLAGAHQAGEGAEVAAAGDLCKQLGAEGGAAGRARQRHGAAPACRCEWAGTTRCLQHRPGSTPKALPAAALRALRAARTPHLRKDAQRARAARRRLCAPAQRCLGSCSLRTSGGSLRMGGSTVTACATMLGVKSFEQIVLHSVLMLLLQGGRRFTRGQPHWRCRAWGFRQRANRHVGALRGCSPPLAVSNDKGRAAGCEAADGTTWPTGRWVADWPLARPPTMPPSPPQGLPPFFWAYAICSRRLRLAA